MASKERDNYIIETFLLSRVNNEQWIKFINVLNAYTREVIETAMSAPPDSIHVSVGRAQQMLSILHDLQGIDVLYKKIKDVQR